MTTTTNEKKLRYAIYGYPSCIVDAISNRLRSGDKSWEIKCLTKDPEFYSQTYEVKLNGETVTTIGRLYGFGFGAQAHYGNYTNSEIDKLRSLVGRNSIDRSMTREELNELTKK